MAEKPSQDPKPTEAEPDSADPNEGGEPEAEGTAEAGMSSAELADAGIAIDLPYESPPGQPEPLAYADDLGDEKGWSAPDGFTIAGVPFDEVVAGIGGGAQPSKPDPQAQEGDGAEPVE